MVIKPLVSLPTPAAPRVVGTRTVRKIALCGSHSSSLPNAPWTDPSWEFWGHAASKSWYRRPMDRYFDLHPKACWTRKPDHLKWLSRLLVPIYMQERYGDVPASIRYPKEQILTEFGDARPYFTNQVAWMIALAMTEGATVIGLWGVNYGIESEYMIQRGSAEYWLGRAAERGIRIVLPPECTLLAQPSLLYGYESHDESTGRLKDEYKQRPWLVVEPVTVSEGLAKPPPDVQRMIDEENAEMPRPAWALGPLPEKANGKVREA